MSSASSSATLAVQDTVGAQIDCWQSAQNRVESDRSPASETRVEAAKILVSGSKASEVGSVKTVSLGDPSFSVIPDGNAVAFRVTCVRGGRKHVFSSMEAAGMLGAGLVKLFGWKAQMKNHDIEVLLNIHGDRVKICIALNKESKSKRNITHFGPTTLKSAIAYGMLR